MKLLFHNALRQTMLQSKIVLRKLARVPYHIIKQRACKYGIVIAPPDMFSVELTNHCNIRCSMCPYTMMKREKGFMSIDMFKDICKQSRKFRLPIAWLSFYGEPLLYPLLDDALGYFKEFGLGIGGISTNGLLLNDKVIQSVVKNCTLIRVALDSTREDVYRVLRNNNQFNLVCENIKHLISAARGSNLTIEIQWLITRLNKDEGMAGFEKLFGTHSYVNYIAKECGVYVPQGPDLRPGICSRWDVANCMQPFSVLNVLWDGRCVFCCRDIDGEQAIGTILDTSLFELWYGSKTIALRRQYITGQFAHLPVCKRCAIYG